MKSAYLQFFNEIASKYDLVILDGTYDYKELSNPKLKIAYQENILPSLIANALLGFRSACIMSWQIFKENFQLVLEITKNSLPVAVFIIFEREEPEFLETLSFLRPKNLYAKAIYGSEIFKELLHLVQEKQKAGLTSLSLIQILCHPNIKTTISEGIIQV